MLALIPSQRSGPEDPSRLASRSESQRLMPAVGTTTNSVAIGSVTSFIGAYASYFLDGATGGIIVTLQTAIFLIVFFLAPKHGLLAARRRAAAALRPDPPLPSVTVAEPRP